MAPQFTATNGPEDRGLRSWSALATSSLPVPDSPVISTVACDKARRPMARKTSCMAGACPRISGTSPSSSDARLKSDIAPIVDALAKVQALTGVTFTMTGSDTRQMGLIAQDVQAVAPEAVVEAEGILRLAYGNLVGLLVEAIKDLAQEVDQLKRTTP